MANWITTKQGNHIDLDLYEAIEDYYRGKETPTLYLERKEYIAIVQYINYLYDKKYKGKDYCHYYSGNAYNQTDRSYTYIFINNGFDDYNIIDKVAIDNYYDELD